MGDSAHETLRREPHRSEDHIPFAAIHALLNGVAARSRFQAWALMLLYCLCCWMLVGLIVSGLAVFASH